LMADFKSLELTLVDDIAVDNAGDDDGAAARARLITEWYIDDL
ncbi:hypothetical protein SeLEV6574_g04100, partial [Synchytrium endobioticum]